MPVTRSPSFPPSGPPSYSPDNLPVYRGGSSGSAPAPSCTITMTGDIGPAFGFAAADVTGGNSFSITDATANVYLASTPFATAGIRRPMPAAGKKVWIQGDSFYTVGGDLSTNARIGFFAFDAGGSPIAIVQLAGGTISGEGVVGNIQATSPAGAFIESISMFDVYGAFPDRQSLGVDSDGELYIYRPDTDDVVALSSLAAGFAGVFSGASTIILLGMCDLSTFGPASAGGRIVTNQADMTDRAALVGDEDWCQQVIV